MASMALRALTTVSAATSERGWRAFTSSGEGIRSSDTTFRFSVCCIAVGLQRARCDPIAHEGPGSYAKSRERRGDMTDQERDAMLAIALRAAYVDGGRDEAERARIEAAAARLGGAGVDLAA